MSLFVKAHCCILLLHDPTIALIIFLLSSDSWKTSIEYSKWQLSLSISELGQEAKQNLKKIMALVLREFRDNALYFDPRYLFPFIVV